MKIKLFTCKSLDGQTYSSLKNDKKDLGKMHSLTLRKKYIYQIRDCGKIVEGRIYSGSILNYKPGDKIRFFDFKNPKYDVVCANVSFGLGNKK